MLQGWTPVHHMAGAQNKNAPTSTSKSLCLKVLANLLQAKADINATDNKVLMSTLLRPSRMYVARRHARTRSHKALACEMLTAMC